MISKRIHWTVILVQIILIGVTKQQQPSNATIDDLFFEMSPGVTTLKSNTPQDARIGRFIVVQRGTAGPPVHLTIESNNPFFYMLGQELYLKSSGTALLKNVYGIYLKVNATIESSTRAFQKTIHIPVEHVEEPPASPSIKVTPVDDLCEQDFNRKVLSISVNDPSQSTSSFECHIERSNYPSIDFRVLKKSTRDFDVLLPARPNLFNVTRDNPSLILQVACAETATVVPRVVDKVVVELYICTQQQDVYKSVTLTSQHYRYSSGVEDERLIIPFGSPENMLIGHLQVTSSEELDMTPRYMFSLAEQNKYVSVFENGTVRLKSRIDKELLKYENPRIFFRVHVTSRDNRALQAFKLFRVYLDITNERDSLPPLRLVILDDSNKPVFRFAQQDTSSSPVPFGRVVVNESVYPTARYDVYVSDSNVTLDSEGNLYISPNSTLFKDPNAQEVVVLNIYDKEENVDVFEENFSINIPPTDENFPATRPDQPSKTTPRSECANDNECNALSPGGGPNKCVKLAELRNTRLDNPADVETLLRMLQYMARKDPTIFLKYDVIIQAVQNPTPDLDKALAMYNMTLQELLSMGFCICDEQFDGWQCKERVGEDKPPHQCHPNSTVHMCNPGTSICRTSGFLLRNVVQGPDFGKVNEYKTYYCECTSAGVIGLNCEYLKSQCEKPSASRMLLDMMRQKRYKRQAISEPMSGYKASTLGNVNDNSGRCPNPNDDFCLPKLNASSTPNPASQYTCNKQEPPVTNYLVFDETGPGFKPDPNNPNGDTYKPLNLSDAGVMTSLQDFLRNEVMPRYVRNDYAKMPKGPLAIIMKPSIDMPSHLNSVRDRVNALITQNDPGVAQSFDTLTANRIQQLVQDTLVYLMANGIVNFDPSTINTVAANIINKLNVSPQNNRFSNAQWTLQTNTFPADLRNGDPSGLIRSLDVLQQNAAQLTATSPLGSVLGLNVQNGPYLDVFNISSRPFSLNKLDIVFGIYVDADGELSLRPTPGIFLTTLPRDASNPHRDIIFLPGLFSPAASANCDVKTLFTPGILSLPLDTYEMANIPNDATKYLNKFTPMELPFNLNGFLTSTGASLSETVTKLASPNTVVNASNSAYLLMTPIDFNPESQFDIITKNVKFMSNLFTAADAGFARVIREQKSLNAQNLASTQVLSNPTMLPLSKQDYLNEKCIYPNGTAPPSFSKGMQLYDNLSPTDNVTVVPFVMYDDQGNPVPAETVKAAIIKYCQNYHVIVNEFHARVCEAQAQTNMLQNLTKTNPEVCYSAPQPCKFTQFVQDYYNPAGPSTKPPKKRPDFLPLMILAALLALLWLSLLLAMCCLCCCCPPLCGTWCCRKRALKPVDHGVVYKKNSAKIFGTPDYEVVIGELIRTGGIPNQYNLVATRGGIVSTSNKSKIFEGGTKTPSSFLAHPDATTSKVFDAAGNVIGVDRKGGSYESIIAAGAAAGAAAFGAEKLYQDKFGSRRSQMPLNPFNVKRYPRNYRRSSSAGLSSSDSSSGGGGGGGGGASISEEALRRSQSFPGLMYTENMNDIAVGSRMPIRTHRNITTFVGPGGDSSNLYETIRGGGGGGGGGSGGIVPRTSSPLPTSNYFELKRLAEQANLVGQQQQQQQPRGGAGVGNNSTAAAAAAQAPLIFKLHRYERDDDLPQPKGNSSSPIRSLQKREFWVEPEKTFVNYSYNPNYRGSLSLVTASDNEQQMPPPSLKKKHALFSMIAPCYHATASDDDESSSSSCHGCSKLRIDEPFLRLTKLANKQSYHATSSRVSKRSSLRLVNFKMRPEESYFADNATITTTNAAASSAQEHSPPQPPPEVNKSNTSRSNSGSRRSMSSDSLKTSTSCSSSSSSSSSPSLPKTYRIGSSASLPNFYPREPMTLQSPASNLPVVMRLSRSSSSLAAPKTKTMIAHASTPL